MGLSYHLAQILTEDNGYRKYLPCFESVKPPDPHRCADTFENPQSRFMVERRKLNGVFSLDIELYNLIEGMLKQTANWICGECQYRHNSKRARLSPESGTDAQLELTSIWLNASREVILHGGKW